MEIVLQPNAVLERADSALLRGRVEDAAALYEQALDGGVAERDRYRALNNLCVAHYLLERYEKAVASCRSAVAHRSNRWLAYNNLGLALTRLGLYEEAIAAFRRGLELAPRSDRLKHNLALTERAYREGRPEDTGPGAKPPPAQGIV